MYGHQTLSKCSKVVYGTPCNIYKDKRILTFEYNYGFKNFKIYNNCPKNAFLKFKKQDKK